MSIAMYEALTQGMSGLFRQGPLIVLTDVPSTEPSIAWLYRNGRIGAGFDWQIETPLRHDA